MTQKTLLRDEQGVTAIEFALISPVLFLLLMGIIEMGLVLHASNVIENATVAGGRYGITGSDYNSSAYTITDDNNNGSRVDVIMQSIADNGGGIVRSERVNIQCQSLGTGFDGLSANSLPAYQCSQNSGADSNPGDNASVCGQLAGSGEVQLYTVSYCWPLFTPIIGQFFDNGEYVIESSLIIQNEEYEQN